MGKRHKAKPEPHVEAKTDKVSFPVWFDQQVRAGKLRSWQRNEVSVFFREKGLSDSEDADKYSELLKLY